MTADPPARRLFSIDLLDEDEYATWMSGGNRAVLTEPVTPPVSIPDVFAAQVDLYPDAVALVAGEKHWTYRELDESSNRLAHLLSDHGARAGAVCGAAGGAVRPGDRRDLGGAQDRRGLSADRPPRAPAGADRVHGGRLPPPRCRDRHCRACRPTRRV